MNLAIKLVKVTINNNRDRVAVITGNVHSKESELIFYVCLNPAFCLLCLRSSHRRCSIEKAVRKNSTIFAGKHLCRCLSFNKVARLRPETLLKRRLQDKCFPMNIAKFLMEPILKNICRRLLLWLDMTLQ